MHIHETRLWINRNYNPIKHWLIVIIGFTLIAFALLSYANSNRLLQKVTTLTQQNKVLSEQNKELNQKNQQYAADTQKVVLQNRSYIRCLSNIFAQYTHNFVPITIDNLESCTIQIDDTSSGTSSKTSNSSANQSGSSSNPTLSSQNAQPVNSQPSNTPQNPPQSSPPTLGQRIMNIVKTINPFN